MTDRAADQGGPEGPPPGPESPPPVPAPQGAAARRGAPSHRRPRDTFAAIDLGTNNCRLLIARPEGRGGFRVVDAFSRSVRLGEGLTASGALSEAAILIHTHTTHPTPGGWER